MGLTNLEEKTAVIGFQYLAHFLANTVNYNRLVAVVIGLCLNEVFSLVVTTALGITSMLHAPLVFVVADLTLTVFLFGLFYSAWRICKEVKSE